MKSYGQIGSVFSLDEISKLVSVFDRLPDQLNSAASQGKNYVRAYTNGIDKNHLLYKWVCNQVCDKIEKYTGLSCHIHVAMYLKEFDPWQVHTDYIKGDSSPGYAFLIPIGWDGPEQSSTHTIIFNEQSTTNLLDYLETSGPKNPNAVDLADSLCSHIDRDVLEKLTLAIAARWNPGDLIYWKRDLLHSSDNFISSGITQKRAIVIFTSE